VATALGPLRRALLGDGEGLSPRPTWRTRLLDRVLRRYAEAEAAAVAPLVRGQRVLDLGGAEGYVAAAVRRRTGAWVCTTEVGPFRLTPGPYVRYDGERLPFPDEAFDTALLLLTLHHCADPEAVLDEALRVTRRRLVVTESVYRNRRERFWLELLDGRVNRHRHGGAMPVPRAFRPPAGWEALFASRGLRVCERRWLGAWWERLVHHPLLFVLERDQAPVGTASGATRR
jgi:SAM-dependent methyltransferase